MSEQRWVCGDCGATEVAEEEPDRCECGSDRFWGDCFTPSEERGKTKRMVCESCGEDFQSSEADGWPTICPDCRPEERLGGSGGERSGDSGGGGASNSSSGTGSLDGSDLSDDELATQLEYTAEDHSNMIDWIHRKELREAADRLHRTTPDASGPGLSRAEMLNLAHNLERYADDPDAPVDWEPDVARTLAESLRVMADHPAPDSEADGE